MNLNRVTITGADDSISPDDLVQLSREFPFVEWGILFSQSSQGRARFPTDEWIAKLVVAGVYGDMKLCAHLCGGWVRDLVLAGNFSFRNHYPGFFSEAERVQVNFHGQFHRAADGFADVLRAHVHPPLSERPVQFILQCDGVNDVSVVSRAADGLAVPLFDTSGGAGLLPRAWPLAWPGIYCGYAGGLSPENVEGQIEQIGRAAGGETIWIDMERRVRSPDDSLFDLKRVHDVLSIVSGHITQLAEVK